MSPENDGQNGYLYYEECLARLYPHFLGNLARKHPNLRVTERRLCALTLLDLNVQDIARVIDINPQSVYSARSKLWVKLGLESIEALLPYLHDLAVENSGGARRKRKPS